MKTTFIILAFFVFLACNHKKSFEPVKSINTSNVPFAKDTIIDLYKGVITLPKGWKIIEDTSVTIVADATSRYTFQNKNGKLIKLEYGLGTGNAMERNIFSARFRKAFIRNQLDTSNILFDDNPKLIEIRKKGKFNISKINVSDFDAYLYEPKQFGKGLVGIYIDSIGTIATNIAQLTLYAENLDSLESSEIRNVINSLKLKHFE